MQKVVLFTLALMSTTTHATINSHPAVSTDDAINVNDASDFERAKGSEQLRYYLYGAYSALGMVNAERAVNGGKKLYCQPAKLSEADVDIVSLVERQLPLSKENYKGGIKGLPIEFVLLDALQGNFPCDK